MLTVGRGPLARFVLIGVLLLPVVGAVSGADARAARHCSDMTGAVSGSLGADLELACRTVLAAVPSWDGRVVMTVVDGDAGVAAETLGAVVSVHREGWSRLTPAGRQEVLTHELVHVATDAFTTPRTPAWLVEGLAEAVALRGSGLADRVVAQELAAVVARRDSRGDLPGGPRTDLPDGLRTALSAGLPTALPTARDFAATPALAYQESWLAVDLLLRSFGDPAVLRLYSAAGVTSLPRALSLLGGCCRSGASAPDLQRIAEGMATPGPEGMATPGPEGLAATGEGRSLLGGRIGSGANGLHLVRGPGALTGPGAGGGPAAEEGPVPLGGRIGSGANGLHLVRDRGAVTVAGLVAALRAEIVRRLA